MSSCHFVSRWVISSCHFVLRWVMFSCHFVTRSVMSSCHFISRSVMSLCRFVSWSHISFVLAESKLFWSQASVTFARCPLLSTFSIGSAPEEREHYSSPCSKTDAHISLAEHCRTVYPWLCYSVQQAALRLFTFKICWMLNLSQGARFCCPLLDLAPVKTLVTWEKLSPLWAVDFYRNSHTKSCFQCFPWWFFSCPVCRQDEPQRW